MDPHAIEAVGYIGAAILNTSAVPQIYKCYKTKSAKDFSWGFFATLLTGMTLNFTYGLLLEHPAIYTGSGVSFVLYGTIAGMKYVYEHHPQSDTPVEVVNTDEETSRILPLSLESDLRTKI